VGVATNQSLRYWRLHYYVLFYVLFQPGWGLFGSRGSLLPAENLPRNVLDTDSCKRGDPLKDHLFTSSGLALDPAHPPVVHELHTVSSGERAAQTNRL
jgi:hypothetical protein